MGTVARAAASVLQRGRKVLEDLNLLKILQSEIHHEVSNPPFQDAETGSLGDFEVDWDSPASQDMVLRRKCDSGEEVVVSALLRRQPFVEVDTERVFPREPLVKVCIKKPGVSSILQFDCRVSQIGSNRSGFDVRRACYLRSLSAAHSSAYTGPRTLVPQLQDVFKQYLVSRGINEGLTSFILYHLNKKEQDQYVDWLRKLESTVGNSLKL